MKGRVTLVTLNYKELSNTLHVIELAKTIGAIEHIVVIDNHSEDGSIEKLLELNAPPYCTILESKANEGYTKGFNQAIRYALDNYKSDYIFVANADIIFDSETVEKLVMQMDSNPEYGLLSPRMLGFYRNEENAAWKYPTFNRILKYCFLSWRKKNGLNLSYEIEKESGNIVPVDVVRSSFNFFRREALEKCGGYDENIFLFNCENMISRQLNKYGYKVGLLADCYYIHNHKPGNVNVLFRMKYCLKENLYYAQKCLSINELQKIMYSVCAVVGYNEMKVVLMLSKLKRKLKER